MNVSPKMHPYLGVPKLTHKKYAQSSLEEYDMIDGAPYDHQYIYYECLMDENHFLCEKMCEKMGKKWSSSTVIPINKYYPSCFHRTLAYYWFVYL